MDIRNADPNPPMIVYKKPITMGARGAVYIPEAVRSRLKLEQGDIFQVSIEDGHIVLTLATMVPAATPESEKAVPRDQAWFYTPGVAGQESLASFDPEKES